MVVGAVAIKKGVVVEVEGEVRILEEVVVVLEEKFKMFKIWEISTSLKVLIFLR